LRSISDHREKSLSAQFAEICADDILPRREENVGGGGI